MRPATEADLPDLLVMGEAFHAASGLRFDYDPEASGQAILGMMANGCVLRTERGAIGGVIGSAWSNPAWRYACELFWWAEDGRGLELLRGFEAWARDQGAQEVRLTSLHHLTRAGRILERSGYAPIEVSYGKVI